VAWSRSNKNSQGTGLIPYLNGFIHHCAETDDSSHLIHRGNSILKLISFVLLVICCIAIVMIAFAVFKLLAIALMVWFVLWLCWQSLKELFTEEDKPP